MSAIARALAFRRSDAAETEPLPVTPQEDSAEKSAEHLGAKGHLWAEPGQTGLRGEPPQVGGADEVLGSPGLPLDSSLRDESESGFGHDFDAVRLHTDSIAASAAKALGASAFTAGRHIVFGQGQYAPQTSEGRALINHELAHVAQQTAAGKASLQRRLLLTGTPGEIADFLAMSEAASGLRLVRNPLTNEVNPIATLVAPARSAAFANRLTGIMADPLQNAEINVGANQPNVDIGAFPVPRDLTAGGVQNVDMDDVNAMEAGAPGIGVADLLHEIVENFEAHGHLPAAGVDLFPAAHAEGLRAESEAAIDIIGAGNRVAQADMALGPNTTRFAEDYDAYYVLSTLTADPLTNRFVRSDAAFAPKVLVRATTVAHFATGSDAVPGAGAAGVATVVADLAANPLATVRLEGFTDSTDNAARNLDLGGRRAANAAAALTLAGVDPGRIHEVARGATGFVAANDTDAHRALNRRVVFTVTRPGP